METNNREVEGKSPSPSVGLGLYDTTTSRERLGNDEDWSTEEEIRAGLHEPPKKKASCGKKRRVIRKTAEEVLAEMRGPDMKVPVVVLYIYESYTSSYFISST